MSIIAASWAGVRPGPMSELGQNRQYSDWAKKFCLDPEIRRLLLYEYTPWFKGPHVNKAILPDALKVSIALTTPSRAI